MTNVVKLELVHMGESVRLDADEILEEAKGLKFHRLVIFGQLEPEEPGGEHELFISATANAGETLILMEIAKDFLVFGE